MISLRRLVCVFVVFCVGSFSLSHAAVEPVPGLNFGGWSDVTSIEIPSGIAGMAPDLSVLHDHNHRDGLLGSNYRLQGPSVITRRSASGGVPELGSDDSESGFYLDGQLLIQQQQVSLIPKATVPLQLVSDVRFAGSAGVNPLNNSYFEPETYDGSRLHYDSQDNIWVMEKNGWRWEYGHKDDYGTNATVTNHTDLSGGNLSGTVTLLCQDTGILCSTVAWHLSRVVDPFGNEVLYNYALLPLTQSLASRFEHAADNWPVISSINYAEGRQRVTFSYRSRPDPRLDASSGMPQVLSHRLSTIKSWVDDEMYSHYTFAYQDERIPAPELPNSMLWKIQRKSTQANTYRDIRTIDVNDVLPGWPDIDQSISLDAEISNPGSSSTDFRHIILPQAANINGDGVSDLVVLTWHCSSICSSYHEIYLATPEASTHFIGEDQASGDDLLLIETWNQQLNSSLDGRFLMHGRGYLLADLNNDYWLDLLVEESISNSDSLGDVQLLSYRSNNQFTATSLAMDACKVRYGRLGDINGDGYQDLIRVVHEATDLCPQANKTRWVANARHAPHFDWNNKQILEMPLDQPALPIQLSAAAAASVTAASAERPLVAGGFSSSGPYSLVCRGHSNGPPNDLSDENSPPANPSKFARFGDFNSDGLVDVLYTLHGCYEWFESVGAGSVSYWIPIEESLYSEIHYGLGDGSFIASGIHAGHPLYTYYESWAIPDTGGGGGGGPSLPGGSIPGDILIPGKVPGDDLLVPWDGGLIPAERVEMGQPASRSDNNSNRMTISARSSSAGWLIQTLYMHNVSPFNVDRSHYGGLLLERERSLEPSVFAYDRGLLDGYGLSNAEQVPADLEILPTRKPGDYHAYGDFDGDGFIDLVTISTLSTYSYPGTQVWQTKLALNTKRTSRGRTVTSTGPYGGEQKLSWSFSADSLHDNPSLPLNLEVLSQTDGKSGRLAYRYSGGVARYGKFRGFGQAELINERGGRTLHGYYMETARQGLQRYAARLRDDDSLQAVTVSLHGIRTTSGGYSYALAPPYFSPLLRQCNYQIGYGDANGSQTTTLDELVDRCHDVADATLLPQQFDDWVLDKPFELWKQNDGLVARPDLNRLKPLNGAVQISARPDSPALAAAKTGGALSTEMVSQLQLRQLNLADLKKEWVSAHALTPLLHDFEPQKSGWRRVPSALRWKSPEGIKLPVKPAQPDLVHNGDTNVVEFVTDYFYDHVRRRLDSQHDRQDTSVLSDNSTTEYSWEKVGTGNWYRLTETLIRDHQGIRFARLKRTDFDPNGFDNAGSVLRCGIDDLACYEDHYTWDDRGRLIGTTANDGGQASWQYEAMCGAVTHTDPVGRTRSYAYDGLCRKQSEAWLTASTEYAYDGFNRLQQTAFDPGGESEQSVIYTLQDDELSTVVDSEFTEPRLARLRSDQQLELTYMDEFGRVTRKVLCKNTGSQPPKDIDQVSCEEGTELITTWYAYTNDGKRLLEAQPFFPDEVVRFSTYHHNELGQIYAAQHPAHTPVDADNDPQWNLTEFARGPGWERKIDSLGRVYRTDFTTLSSSETVNGLLQTRSTIDAFGRYLSMEQPGGIVENYKYDNYNRLALRHYQQPFSCWIKVVGNYVPSQGCQATVEYEYDDNGRQNRIRFADNTERLTEFDHAGRPVTESMLAYTGSTIEQNQQLRQWNYQDTVSPPEVEITDENGHVRTLTSATLGQITNEDLNGLSTQREFGIHGKLVREVDPNGLEITYTYDLYDRLSSKTIGGVDRTEYTYNGQNHLLQKVDADGVIETWQYTYSGKPAARYLGKWLMETHGYDESGRKVNHYTDGIYTRYEYDDFDQLTQVMTGLSSASANDPLAIYTYDYDAAHRLIADTAYPVEGQQVVNEYRYNPVGLLEAVIDANGHERTYEYDNLMALHRQTDAEGYTASTHYDFRGRVIAQDVAGTGRVGYRYKSAVNIRGIDEALYAIQTIDPAGIKTVRYYDAGEQLVQTDYPDGSRLRRHFDGTLLAAESVVDRNQQVISETRYVYGPAGFRLSQVVGPDSLTALNAGSDLYTVDYTYTNAGRLKALASPVETIDYEYDAEGLLSEETYPDSSIEYFRENTYPVVSRKTHIAQQQMRETVYVRNRNGKLIKQQISAAGNVETRQFKGYDAYGNPSRSISQLNGVAQVRQDWTYTPTGRMASRTTYVEGQSIGSVKWDYYKNGVMQAVQDPTGQRVAYRFGTPFDYHLTAVDNDQGEVFAKVTSYNKRGQITELVMPGNNRVRFEYDEMGRESVRQYQRPGQSPAGFAYQYDTLGRKTQQQVFMAGDQSSVDYHYDGKGRLQTETRSSPGMRIDYEWDVAGNLMSKQLTEGGTTDYYYQAQIENNRVVTVNGQKLHYDAWGNVSVDQHRRRFTRLPSGLVRQVTTATEQLSLLRDSDGISWASKMDGHDNAMLDIWRQDYAGIPLASRGDDMSWQQYVMDDSELVIDMLHQQTGNSSSDSMQPVYDHNDTLYAKSSQTMPVMDAFGEPLFNDSMTDDGMSQFNYQGMASYAAMPGLHFSRYRIYDPASARFASRDPAGLRGGYHPYAYVQGDPVNYTDSLGLFAIPETSSNGGFGGLGTTGTSFMPPNTSPDMGGDSDGPFDPGWGKDGCPITAMCAADTGSQTTDETGGSSVDASEAEATETPTGDTATAANPTETNSADLDGYRWETEIFYEPADGFVSWREGDGELQTADVKSVEQFDEGTKLVLEDNPSGATSLFILENTPDEETPSSTDLSGPTDVEAGSEIDSPFGMHGEVLGEIFTDKWTGFTDSLWSAADAAMNPVDTWMNNTPGGLALQGDWNGAGWSMVDQVTMPYQMGWDIVYTGGRAVVGSVTNPYHMNRFIFATNKEDIRYHANQFIDNQVAAVETASLFTGAGAGRKVIMKGLSKAIPKRPRLRGRCSFVEGTSIYTEAGLKPISTIFAGDLVASTVAEIIDIEYQEVVESYTREADSYYELKFSTAEGGASTVLLVTNEHPVWVIDEGWVNAENITIGDPVITIYGTRLVVTDKTYIEEPSQVFNIAVEETENYFAGEHGILVHNCHHFRNDGITPGPFAVNPTPLRQGSHRRWTRKEKRAVNKEGYENGCNTCGRKDPGGFKNFVVDEYPRMSNNNGVFPRYAYPQCRNCMIEQAKNAAADARWDADAFKDWD